jgi:osmoprotectant transport system permease protein
MDARAMTFLLDVWRWFVDPAHYAGADAVQTRVLEHVELSALAVAIASAIALPIGLALGHTGRFGFIAVNVANVGRALPSLALLALALLVALPLGLGFGFWPTFVALVPLAVPPVLTNAYAGVRNVDRDTIEAARGMGLGETQVLLGIELPLAMPLVLAGIRNAAVNVVATATLGAVVASGGLGRYIVDGFALQEYERVFAGALLVAVLAISVEVALGIVERTATSPGMTGRSGA